MKEKHLESLRIAGMTFAIVGFILLILSIFVREGTTTQTTIISGVLFIIGGILLDGLREISFYWYGLKREEAESNQEALYFIYFSYDIYKNDDTKFDEFDRLESSTTVNTAVEKSRFGTEYDIYYFRKAVIQFLVDIGHKNIRTVDIIRINKMM